MREKYYDGSCSNSSTMADYRGSDLLGCFVNYSGPSWTGSSFFPPSIGPRPPVEPVVLPPDETIGIEGVWGDTFSVQGQEGEEVRAAVLSIKKTDEGYRILGHEYDKNLEVFYDWDSIAATFEHGKLEYLFSATEKLPKDQSRDIKGFTSLRFIVSSDKRPETYSGYFVDIWIESGEICTRSDTLRGRRIADHEAHLYDTNEGRSYLAKRLMEERIIK